jgi:hypothetical protein
MVKTEAKINYNPAVVLLNQKNIYRYINVIRQLLLVLQISVTYALRKRFGQSRFKTHFDWNPNIHAAPSIHGDTRKSFFSDISEDILNSELRVRTRVCFHTLATHAEARRVTQKATAVP